MHFEETECDDNDHDKTQVGNYVDEDGDMELGQGRDIAGYKPEEKSYEMGSHTGEDRDSVEPSEPDDSESESVEESEGMEYEPGEETDSKDIGMESAGGTHNDFAGDL